MSDKITIEKFKTQAYLIQAAIDGMEILTKPMGTAEERWITKPFNEYFDFFHQDYRVATVTADDIDWSEVPERCNWAGVDSNGNVAAFPVRPSFSPSTGGYWYVNGEDDGGYVALGSAHKRGGDWAIFERPRSNMVQGSLTEYMSGDGYSVKVIYVCNQATIDMPAHWVGAVFDAHTDEPIEDIGGFSVIRQSLVDSIKKQLELRFTKPKQDIKKLYEWFCDEDGDMPTVEMCLQRIEEMRRAEIVLRGFVHDYNKNQLFLNQHQFPIEDNVATPSAIRQVSPAIP